MIHIYTLFSTVYDGNLAHLHVDHAKANIETLIPIKHIVLLQHIISNYKCMY